MIDPYRLSCLLKRMMPLNLIAEPKWVIEPKDTEGVRDQDVVIKCEAFAKPAPKYTWLRNGIVLGGTNFIMFCVSLYIGNFFVVISLYSTKIVFYF